MNDKTTICPNCGLAILPDEDYCSFCEDAESDSTELIQMYEDQYDLAGNRCTENGEPIPEDPYSAEEEASVWGEKNCDFDFFSDDCNS